VVSVSSRGVTAATYVPDAGGKLAWAKTGARLAVAVGGAGSADSDATGTVRTGRVTYSGRFDAS
jgi:hypothetical protein